MTTFSTLRTATAVNTALVAAAASGVFLAAYGLTSTGGLPANTAQPTTSAAAGTLASGSAAAPVQLVSFTDATSGDCVTWDQNDKGTVSNFQKVSCEQPHRFEVASREDLAVYPTSEFGQQSPLPSLERQAELREELCQGATLKYLDGKYDPTGKFSIAPILPPEKSWVNGDRTMLCGLQTTDASGLPLITEGKVAAADQANIAAPGACRMVDERQTLRTVDCSEPHQLETVAVINLREQFPDRFPSPDEQNDFLNGVCTRASEDYLGGEENLYQSTLSPYWGSVLESSWAGGTYSVNCSLMHVNPETSSFSTIVGSAKGGRAALNINGAPPTEQPVRNPLRQP
ncbi:hypothetical protein CPHO_11630 [Corynebacterium phocae]|uniref:Septum formation-related domain-containing protein n=1 Tax=Corynebacterium phocae TaxID=161895 RepID=A0A1L7D615_9CORY|nr:septum formation family protein [Corynebacterium phocae]APT93433.1 hypothetical protein CPHO_11630 [Corynebacterium phocae]KAA8721127.1 hypothetical protein F4V58_11105 [Corynebacterium phocae]